MIKDILEEDAECTCCSRTLKAGRPAVWLELNQELDRYTDQPVPAEHSQGSFVFGTGCAKRALNETGPTDINAFPGR